MILLIYEDEISKLHPQCRRHWHPATKGTLASNRIGVLHGINDVDEKIEDVECSLTALQKEYTVLRLRNKIVLGGSSMVRMSKLFNGPVTGGDAYINGDRNRLVNFTSAVRGQNAEGKDFPSTIEFRQARGSLEMKDIRKWVDFCIGLVRLAHFYHDNPDKFPVKKWEDRISVFDLIAQMDLGAEAEEYWSQKQQFCK